MSSLDQDTRMFSVVVNHEEQYSIWLAGKKIPEGWRETGFSGKKDDCLAHIDSLWTDMRPLSLRRRMAEQQSSS
jgi:MbtH protein